jgi:hypothetical protein
MASCRPVSSRPSARTWRVAGTAPPSWHRSRASSPRSSALTGRILERVLPSRARRRRLAALGWSYAGALTACVGAVALWALQPGGNAQLETLSGQLSHRLLGAGLFALNLLGASAVRLADGWSVIHVVGGRLAPLSRALGAVLTEPGIAFTIWAAAAVCAALLWWMRPRAGAAARGVHHVGVLGF